MNSVHSEGISTPEIYEETTTNTQQKRGAKKLEKKTYSPTSEEQLKSLVKGSKLSWSKLQRTPSWAHNDPRIAALFAEAQLKGLQVNHILPLKGKFVSGLHVFENLQLLDKSQNSSKGNRIDLAAYNLELTR